MKHAFTKHQCLSLKEIKAYLNKEVSQEKKEVFNQHFETCALCREVKEMYPSINEAELTEDTAVIKEAIFGTLPQKKQPSRRLFISRIAASLLFLITGSAALFYWNVTATNRLYDQYFQPYDIAEIISRGERGGLQEYNDASLPKDLELALDAYNEGNYKESLPHFESYFKIQPQNTYANFLNAIANLEENNTDTAIASLKAVRINEDSLYVDATWYLALAHLRKNEKQEVLHYLDALEKVKSNFYAEKATALRQKMK